MSDLKTVRKDYDSRQLLESTINKDPFALVESWLKDAKEHAGLDYNAMTFATTDEAGFPNLRTVLLRGFSRDGISFYTNYTSSKAKEIEKNNKVGVNFFWKELERQIRMKGIVKKATEADSDAYFASRPRASQLGAWVSDQSSIIENREVLDQLKKEVEERFEGKDVTRPPFWGGYTIQITYFEFWQGRPGRLHDRIAFMMNADGEWFLERLAP